MRKVSCGEWMSSAEEWCRKYSTAYTPYSGFIRVDRAVLLQQEDVVKYLLASIPDIDVLDVYWMVPWITIRRTPLANLQWILRLTLEMKNLLTRFFLMTRQKSWKKAWDIMAKKLSDCVFSSCLLWTLLCFYLYHEHKGWITSITSAASTPFTHWVLHPWSYLVWWQLFRWDPGQGYPISCKSIQNLTTGRAFGLYILIQWHISGK